MQRLNTDLTVFCAAPNSIQLVTPIRSARKELVEPIDLWPSEPLQQSAPVVRTGCIPCLSLAIQCGGPYCHRTAISQAWGINTEVSPLQHGTWRERQGLHMFVDLALAPQRMAMFGSSFWNQTVMQLVLGNAAVFHVASGIGALREHLLRADSGQQQDSTGTALTFGLRQCNKAIALLTQAAREGRHEYSDPGIALVVCVLFTTFDALYGDPVEALTHVLQGRKILCKCEQFPSGGGASSVIDTTTVRPVLAGMQLQATCLSGLRASEVLGNCPLDSLPLPDVDCIHSLEHANRILHVVYSNLLLYHQHLRSYIPGENFSVAVVQKRLRFAPWLQMWEKRFAKYLFQESSSLVHQDMQKAKVLKANHLLSTILAQVDTTSGWQAWEPFTVEFKAIIDLATAVLNTHHTTQRTDFSNNFASMPCMSFGLWIPEPLFVCLSRCTNEEYRRQAAGLLNGVPRSQRGTEQAAGGTSAPSTVSGSGTTSRASTST